MTRWRAKVTTKAEKNRGQGPEQTPHKPYKTSTTNTKQGEQESTTSYYTRYQATRTARKTPPKSLGPKQKKRGRVKTTKATSKKSLNYVFSWIFWFFSPSYDSLNLKPD